MTSDTQPRSAAAVLLPQSVSRRRLPVNLKEGELELFGHELERVIPQTRLLELRDVWVSSDGVLFKGGKTLPESFAFPLNRERWKKRTVFKFFASNYLFRRRRVFERDAVWIADDWSAGYFHWLADALTRLFAVRDRLRGAALLLPHQHQSLEFVRPSLKPFAVREVEFIGRDEVLFCRRLLVPTPTAPSGHYREETIRAVGRLLRECYADAPGAAGGERVYISRGGARKRRILNEEEVVEILRGFAFEIVRAEDCPFERQVKVAARARHLVSNHGAGLTNMLFMRPGGSVLELRHRADRVNNCYFTLASALNLNYFYQTCEPGDPGEDPHTADLFVDGRALRENLELMLA